MKFSERWLREWVDPPIETAALAARLTMGGLEVDGTEPVAPAFDGVVVGRVIEVQPHPEADRLRVCRVDDGSATPLTIVCGAPNVAAGMLAPTARIGARLPGGLKIGRARLRGIESQGMLCSARELGLGEAAEGLWSLPADARPGADLRDYLALDDVSIELGITPNRGDCLGIAGIAREVGVLCGVTAQPPSFPPAETRSAERLPIDLQAPEACPRYLGRVISGIDPAARTPLWMQERLRRSGLRSLGPVVDVTNYVLLEYGQPMHAFDLARLAGGIRVRLADAGESLTLLDGRRIDLEADMLVIADHERAVALAGIMGGEGTAVGPGTESVFLECAWFAPAAISGRARRLGLNTDSAYRFERGVDPDIQRLAMERASRLIVDIAGGRPGPIEEAYVESALPQRAPVRLRRDRLRRVLGYAVSAEEVSTILLRLGMTITTENDDYWEVIAPSFRFDIAIEADLIEEIARVHGYERIPAQPPRGPLRIRPLDARGERERSARNTLSARGYQEVITYSFIDPDLQRRFDPGQAPLELANPISADTAVMRTSLWPSLAQAALHNLNRQQPRVRIFELGSKYLLQDPGLKEFSVISGLAVGDAWPEQWGAPARETDFHDMKSDLEALFAALCGTRSFAFDPAPHPALHPGQSARIRIEAGDEIGWIGRMHPRLSDELGFATAPLLFEILLDDMGAAAAPVFRELSKFPAVRRDLAIIVDEAVPAGDVLEQIRRSAGSVLQGLSLFDIYQGKGVDSGKKSLALGLTFQDFSRTLTDAEIEVLIQDVLRGLRDGLGATLRE